MIGIVESVKILSLFDGMSCGSIAFNKFLDLNVKKYDAYEIDKYAIQVAKNNFPNIEEHGDVFQADFTQYRFYDFLIGGSPCTYWSIAQQPGKRETVSSGLGWDLFSQYVRALNEAKPRFFIYENNQSMSKAIRKAITDTFGFEPYEINSASVVAQSRKRLYWVGKATESGYVRVDVPALPVLPFELKDYLDVKPRFAYAFSLTGDFGRRRASISKIAYCLAANPSSDMKARVIYPIPSYQDGAIEIKDGKIKQRDKYYDIGLEDGWYILRDLSVAECKRVQTIPEEYSFDGVSKTQAKKLIGNGWTIDVICHLIDSCYRS